MKTKKIVEEFDENGNLVKRTIIEEEGENNWVYPYYPWYPSRTDETWGEPFCTTSITLESGWNEEIENDVQDYIGRLTRNSVGVSR